MTKTKKTDYPSPEVRYEAALEEVKEKLQTGELFEKSTPFERRVVDIPALRKRYGMTQQQFADAFGIAIGTLRNWEQGRRIPDGPAQCLLEIIEDRPDVAADVLGERAKAISRVASVTDLKRRDVATRQLEELTAEAQKTMEEGVEKMTKGIESAAAFGQDNVEAVVASSKIAAKAAESMGAEIAAYSKKSYEDGLAAAKELTTVKSVSELFEKQTTFTKASFEKFVSEATRLNEMFESAARDAKRPARPDTDANHAPSDQKAN